MKQLNKKISVILLSSTLLFAQSAFAARLGNKRNLGMQRNTTTSYQNRSNYNSYQTTNTQQPAPQAASKSGLGVGSVVAGAAAGAVGGYMLGKAMNSSDKTNSSQATQQSVPVPVHNERQIPWGIITILGLLLVIGLMIFRRKSMPQISNPANLGSVQNSSGNTNFDIPNIRRNNDNYNTQAPLPQPVGNQAPIPEPIIKVADGVETQYFLRQAKGMFLHIQSMNTPENVSEIAKYMTPELYAEVRNLINENDYVADFSQLDCSLLQSTIEGENYIASVRFFGLVSDAPGTPPTQFGETWHFIKSIGQPSAKWLVAGIQQENVN